MGGAHWEIAEKFSLKMGQKGLKLIFFWQKNSCFFSGFFPWRNWRVPRPPLTVNHCVQKSLAE